MPYSLSLSSAVSQSELVDALGCRESSKWVKPDTQPTYLISQWKTLMAPNAQSLTRPNGSNLPRRSPKKNKNDSHMAASEEVKLLTRYVVLSLLGKTVESLSRRADTLKRLVQELESDNNLFFSSVCQQLGLTTTNAYVSFNAVSDEIFTDQINWGRIVSYYAFSVKMAQYFQSQRQDWMVERVIAWTQEYIGKLEPWINGEGGGWVSTKVLQHDSFTKLNGWITLKYLIYAQSHLCDDETFVVLKSMVLIFDNRNKRWVASPALKKNLILFFWEK